MISELTILKYVSAAEPAGRFKVASYEKAIKRLKTLGPITCEADIPDGFGAEVRKKLIKILDEGSLEIPAALRVKGAALSIFMNIYGIGPKKAEDLFAEGYTTLEDLRDALAADTKLLNKNQKIGLTYYEQLLERIPRAEMDEHAALLMAAKPKALEGVIVGSYRRGAANSGDIDMLVRTASAAIDAAASLTAFVTSLKASGYIKEVLAHGDHKCMAICQLPGATARRLDLLVTPPSEFPFAVHYFTGCDTFNVAVRSHALTKGYTLNEHGLVRVSTGTPVEGIKVEKDIFTVLKLAWKEPTERTGPDAVVPL